MKWFLLLTFPLLGLATQVPLRSTTSVSDLIEFRQPKSNVLTPANLIELSRPGAGIANEAGDLVLVPVTKYSIEERKNYISIFIASLESKITPLQIRLTNGGDAFWLDNRTIGHVVSNGDDVQELYAISVKVETQPDVLSTPSSPILIGSFPEGVEATNFRYTFAGKTLVFSASVWPDMSLENVKKKDKKWEERGSSALVYDELYDRHWDHWILPKKSTLFTVKLAKEDDCKWVFGHKYIPILKGTKHIVPVGPFGGTDDFDVSTTSIVYTTKDPKVSPAEHTRQDIYIVDIHGKSKPHRLTSGKQGATHNPVFSKQGDKIAWTEMAEDGYEADRSKLVIYDLEKDVRFTVAGQWDRSVGDLSFSEDGKNISFIAADTARNKIFALPVPPTPSDSSDSMDFDYTPVALTSKHSASGIQVLPGGRILYTLSTLTKPNDVHIIRGLDEPDAPLEFDQITNFTETELKGKDLTSPKEFWFEGAKGRQVQGWVFTPPGFSEDDEESWPAVLMIHGGPQGVFDDSWSTRWNPVVWAHQGYVIVQINPTGSTSFGQEFTDGIKEDWGGKPFVDLKKGWDYFLENHPQVDRERLVAAGASFGGYAINWIQGHPDYEFGFKALFCHDGVFDSRYNGYSTDELFFFDHEFGGKPWEPKAKEIIRKFNPANYVENWSTPQLIVHGSKDYRLPETDGIGAFHALKQRGVPSRLVIFPDENHWVLKHLNSLKWHHEVFRWFDQFVGAGKR